MQLKVKQEEHPVHTEIAVAAGWSPSGALYTLSDDKTIQAWNMQGEAQGEVAKLENFVADMQWAPGGKRGGGGADVFAAACTNGTLLLCSKSGRVEKSVVANKGAVICLRWNLDGTAVATGGEDGLVKLWSKAGMLRSKIVEAGTPVHAVAWNGAGDKLLVAAGPNLIIKPLLGAGAKAVQWAAHDGVVMQADWSPISGLIVTGGEDRKYKVWDSYGRALYASPPMQHAVTAVAWAPAGEIFAAGSYNALRVCDRTGWTISKSTPRAGSLMALSWTADGTQLAAAGGNGSVVFGHLSGLVLESARTQVTLVDEHSIHVYDLLNEVTDELDFRDRVIKLSLGHGHLVVATSTQCCIYSTASLNTPHMFDLNGVVSVVLQSARNFALVDNYAGIKVYTYEGREMANPKVPGVNHELLSANLMSLAPDALAVCDPIVKSDPVSGAPVYTIHFIDMGGRQIAAPLHHPVDIVAVALNQTGALADRFVAYVDRNAELWLSPVLQQSKRKLSAMCDSVAWHDTTDMLAAMCDAKLVVWYYPNVVYVDKDIAPKVRSSRSDQNFGKNAQLTVFSGARCTIRRADGIEVYAAVSPYPIRLYDQVKRKQWEAAIRLCRFVKDPQLWACLAVMAMSYAELATAEVAFAAIEEVARLQFVLSIKEIPSDEGRAAELALYRRKPEEAENICLQAGLIYRAININIRMFQWERALELAKKHTTHIDTVMWHRSEYLKETRQSETLASFQELSGVVEINEEDIKAKIARENEEEAARPNARRYMG